MDRADAGALRARATRKRRGDSDAVHRAAIRAKALDTLRGMLPAATQSNVGIYGTGQAFEALLLRMRAQSARRGPRSARDQMLAELRKVIPAFLVARRSARARRPLERVPAPTRDATTAALAAALARRQRRRSRATRSR